MKQPSACTDEALAVAHLAPLFIAELGLAVACVDAEGTIAACSAEFAAYGAEARESSLGLPLTELFPELIGHEQDLSDVACGRSPRFELPRINRSAPSGDDPSYITLTMLPHPTVVNHAVLLVQDVTTEGRLEQRVTQSLNELRLLRAELEAKNRRLVELDEQKSAFLRMAAHDLRAPLSVIKGYVDFVIERDGNRLSQRTTDDLHTVQARIKQMTQLIDSLLNVERIDSGEASLCCEPVAVARLVEQVGQGFQMLAEQRGLTLQWSASPDLPHPLGDPDRLAEALANLVSNALKFTPPGGEVRIEAFVRGDVIDIEVSDTGPGISEQDQARLFQSFFRSEEARQRRIPGSGLGLIIVRAIIEQHGGQVYCRSQVGQGSTFGMSLPISGHRTSPDAIRNVSS
ncbi:MAG: PAS domain-containing protein [Anaerolineales bacterium]|nr:PAS domain-containing protein [Anaerolineales bacterium]